MLDKQSWALRDSSLCLGSSLPSKTRTGPPQARRSPQNPAVHGIDHGIHAELSYCAWAPVISLNDSDAFRQRRNEGYLTCR